MNNKIKTLLVIAASAALTSCSFTPSTGSTGTVTEENAPEIQGLYADAIENVEELESIEEPSEESEPEESIPEESEPEESIPEESEPEESEPEESIPEESEPEESEPTEEEPSIEDTITSYHVDYGYEFAVKASVEGYAVIDLYEKESYSLTYVNDEKGLFLDMSLTHEYKENAYCYGSETVHAIFQDQVLYVDSSITVGEYTYEVSKDAYEIKGNRIYGEFGDFFRYTSNDLLLDSTGKESSYDLLAELIASENVEVTAAEGSLITITISNEDTLTSLTFDTELEMFTGATIDESAAIKGYLESMLKNDVVTIDEAKSLTTISFTYNSSEANRLTEEEIAEYNNNHWNYGHHNDHHGYDNQGHNGGHGHDHDDWNDNDGWGWDDEPGHGNGHGQDPWGGHNHEDWGNEPEEDDESSDHNGWDWGDEDDEDGWDWSDWDDEGDDEIEVGGTDTSSENGGHRR